MAQTFREAMEAAYALDEPALYLGAPLEGTEALAGVRVQVALGMLNRHGLVAGATGTGKTKTLQGLAGQLSRAGVPTFIADVKGDLTGLAAPGDGTNPKVLQRAAQLGIDFQPSGHPVELLSLSGQLGAQVRATVSSFGPLLLARILDLNNTQTSVLSLVFKYCDDHDLPLLDLADLRTTLKFLGSAEGKSILEDYGGMSSASIGVIQRALVNLEQQGADAFFGEPAFEVEDLLRTRLVGAVTGADGQLIGGEEQGIVHLLEISDVMDRPKLFSTFMLWMLAQLYQALPEAGDLPKPKLVFFFDEAHLLFEDASEALLDQIEQTVRLIRSKGVGVFFVTQVPTDVPSSVLAQLGNRIQHALRVFTPEDADLLKKTVRTFPMTDYFDVGETLTSLGTGEALVTVLSPRGVPTALAPTRIAPPDSLMAALPPEQIQSRISNSPLYAEYGQSIDRESAHEILSARIAAAKAAVAGATTAPGEPMLTPAQERRAIEARARELEKIRREAERDAKAAERRRATEDAAARREAERAARQRDRMIEEVGTGLLRGVFGTLFGSSGRRRR
jgi:DNA helicase HerA-like ATPase